MRRSAPRLPERPLRRISRRFAPALLAALLLTAGAVLPAAARAANGGTPAGTEAVPPAEVPVTPPTEVPPTTPPAEVPVTPTPEEPAATPPAGEGTAGTEGTEPTTPPATPRHHTKPQTKPKPKARQLTRLTALPPQQRTNGTLALRVRLSGPPAPGSPRPTITPAVAGSWKTVGSDEFFKPASTLEPCADYRLTIPAATQARGDRPLGHDRRLALRVSCPSTRALQQVLSRLGYLPYTLRKSHTRSHDTAARNHDTARTHSTAARATAAAGLFAPPAGRLVANFRGAPPLAYGTMDTTTEGALEVYEDDHGLASSSQERLWQSLLAAETLGHRDPHPYTFVTVTESSPETLEVHEGSRVVLSSPANTGVSGAETALGEFPIYARYTSTAMVGTDPDGTHYDDPDVPWVNYFNGGDAVHGYERASYGSPQSNGCVELPIGTAQRVYGMLGLGDIVIVAA